MDTDGVADVGENRHLESTDGEQFLPPPCGIDDGGPVGPLAGDGVERLREDLRRLAEEVATIDRRDAAQHGGLKGEIAHLVRRIARLEALPKARPAR